MPRQKLEKPANQSAECRRYYGVHPHASPKECVAGLKREGFKVSLHTASNAKYRPLAVPAVRMETMTPEAMPAVVVGHAAENGEFNVSDLLALKQFAQAHGGLDNVGAMAAALKQVQLG